VALSTYECTAQSAAPPAAVFEVIADATRWHEWAGFMINVSEWEREGDPAPGGVGAIRKLGRWPAFTREQLLDYEPPRHLAYTILSRGPLRGYHADVDLEATATGTTIRWSGAFEPVVPGTGGLLAEFFRRTVLSYARAAAAEAERRA
jgi:uncharacterized protein YndB with AHSA1/START domain